MGQEFYCDLCRKPLPTAESLQAIMIGEKKVADVCLTCGSAIGSGISKQIAEAAAAMKAALNQPNGPGPIAPTVPTPPEVPPQAQDTDPPEPKNPAA